MPTAPRNWPPRSSERLARFEREAKTLASLNHPNIAQIYGFEKVDVASGFLTAEASAKVVSRTSALVMELVEGEDLSQRIARGAAPSHSTTRCRLRNRSRSPSNSPAADWSTPPASASE